MPKETNRPESGLWKDFINRKSIDSLAEHLGRVYKKFDRNEFVTTILSDGFFQLELKDRITTIATKLNDFMPKDYSRTTKLLIKIAPELDALHNWIMTDYVRIHGVNYFEESINALKELTKYGTSEFAIKVFINRYTDKMIPILNEWAIDDNEHVRRLAAEGSRPRGVWVEHIDEFKKDPKPVLDLLEKLKADPSLYVRKAVANNLNDISKEHPKTVIRISKRWKKDKNKLTDWIIKHGCRSLIKQGYPEVFPLFDFASDPKIEISDFALKKTKIKLNDKIEIPFSISSSSNRTQKLAIDYAIQYMKKNGKLSRKVFKLSEKKLESSKQIDLRLRHSFINNSTRKHNNGKHQIELMVCGKSFGIIDISLSV